MNRIPKPRKSSKKGNKYSKNRFFKFKGHNQNPIKSNSF